MSTKPPAEPHPGQRNFLTIKQLAEYWQRDERSIHRDIRSGDLTVHRFGRSVRIEQDDILAFQAKKRKKY